MKVRQWWWPAVILCVCAGAVQAEWQRTIVAGDTRLPAQGKVQAQLGGGYEAWEDGDTLFGQLQVGYGISDRWAAYVAPSFVSWDVDDGDSESGLGDTGLGTVYRFLDEADSGFDLALHGAVGLPTGDDDKYLGTGSVEPELNLLVSKTLGPVVAVANAGGYLILDADRGEEDFVLQGVLEGLYPLGEKWSLNAALSAETARADGEDDDVDLTVGARFLPKPQLLFTAGVLYCLADIVDWGAYFSAGYEF